MSAEIQLQLTEDDIVDAGRLYNRWFFRTRKHLIITVGIFLAAQLFLIAVYYLGWVSERDFPTFLLIMECCFAFGIFVAPLLANRFFGSSVAKRHFRSMKNLQEPMIIGWSKEGYRQDGITSTSLTPWTNFYDWHEDEKAFMLLMSERMYVCAPKRVLNEAQVSDLRDHLMQFIIKP